MEPGESEQDEATGSGSGGLARNRFRDYLTAALSRFMSTFLGFPEKRVTCCYPDLLLIFETDGIHFFCGET